MAAVTITKRAKNSVGSLLMEVANVSIAADGDTYVSLMQAPSFAFFVANTDGDTTQLGVNVAISGKTLTFNDSNISTTVGTLVVFGT